MIGFVIILSVLVGQDKYQFFLKSDENLKLVGKNYDIIKTELDKMLTDYNSKIDLDNYWKEKYSEEVYTGSSFNEDGYLTALLSLNNPSQADADYLKRSFTRRTYKNVGKERNRVIERGETLFTKEAEWSDVVSYYGGYSELSKLGISKDDKSKFDVAVVFEKIELIGSSTCLAHVKINGNDDALKFHKIPKSTYKYKGNYKINYDKNYLALYNGPNGWMDFKFDEKKYLPKTKTEINVQLSESIFPFLPRGSINLMFDDLIPYEVIIKHNPLYSELHRKYIIFYSDNDFKKDIFELKYQEILRKIFDAEEQHERNKKYTEKRKKEEKEFNDSYERWMARDKMYKIVCGGLVFIYVLAAYMSGQMGI